MRAQTVVRFQTVIGPFTVNLSAFCSCLFFWRILRLGLFLFWPPGGRTGLGISEKLCKHLHLGKSALALAARDEQLAHNPKENAFVLIH